jgi:hypothetical protein
MHITYERPTTIGEQIDPAAPAADLDPTGAECAATTYDVGGFEWHCTRRPNHTDDEHRAAFDVHGGGPTGAVAFAWQYEWGGAGPGPASTDPMTTVTVTVSFPSTAWTNEQLPDAIADEIRSVFWECDHDDVTVATTATSTPHPVTG